MVTLPQPPGDREHFPHLSPPLPSASPLPVPRLTPLIARSDAHRPQQLGNFLIFAIAHRSRSAKSQGRPGSSPLQESRGRSLAASSPLWEQPGGTPAAHAITRHTAAAVMMELCGRSGFAAVWSKVEDDRKMHALGCCSCVSLSSFFALSGKISREKTQLSSYFPVPTPKRFIFPLNDCFLTNTSNSFSGCALTRFILFACVSSRWPFSEPSSHFHTCSLSSPITQ